MTLRQWIIGCLYAGIEQSAKLSLVVLGSYTVGLPLDVKTLSVSASVGFLIGACRFVYLNKPAVDDDELPLRHLSPPIPVDLKDK